MRLLIRADGDRQIGAGHVMRAIALAEHARAAGDCATMLSVGLDEALRARAGRAGLEVLAAPFDRGTPPDAAWTAAEARRERADWIVLDGRFGPAYQAAVSAGGCRVLLVDDGGQPAGWTADAVLNQNVIASPALYPRAAVGVRLLLGPRYALLRRAFTPAGPAALVADRAARVLVTMGGADPVNATRRVLDALARVADPRMRVKAVVGPVNPRGADAVVTGDPRVEIVPPADDMTALMRWADLAVSAAGSTVHELCCLGLPALVVAIVPSHVVIAEALERDGLAVNLGWHENLDPGAAAVRIAAVQADRGLRSALARNGRARVDGRGAERVLDVLRSMSGEQSARHA